MSTEPIIVDAGHFYCAIPKALVTNGDDVTLCAGVMFRQIDDEQCELLLLSEAQVEELTKP